LADYDRCVALTGTEGDSILEEHGTARRAKVAILELTGKLRKVGGVKRWTSSQKFPRERGAKRAVSKKGGSLREENEEMT